MSVDHYENFPVASVLCPPRLRPAIVAIYRYARTADDIADEGDASAEDRLATLSDFRRDLVDASINGSRPASSRWPEVFGPLSAVMQQFNLPVQLLHDLLNAFEQDTRKHLYATRSELLDYCRMSANPIGRLVLHLHGIADPTALQQSDAVCTALQLINFWQDLSVDIPRGRLYVPTEDLDRRGVPIATFLRREDRPLTRAVVGDMLVWARSLMTEGSPLVHRLPGRAGWELRVVVQGGLRIIDKIDRRGYDSFLHRPRLSALDVPLLLSRAFFMRKPRAELPSARSA